MDSFHRHLDELERLLGDSDKKKERMKSRALSFAAFVGSNPVVETLIQKGVGKDHRHPIRVLARPLGDSFAPFGYFNIIWMWWISVRAPFGSLPKPCLQQLLHLYPAPCDDDITSHK